MSMSEKQNVRKQDDRESIKRLTQSDLLQLPDASEKSKGLKSSASLSQFSKTTSHFLK
jgi:hypothetical protein